jgi:hypothetical protein
MQTGLSRRKDKPVKAIPEKPSSHGEETPLKTFIGSLPPEKSSVTTMLDVPATPVSFHFSRNSLLLTSMQMARNPLVIHMFSQNPNEPAKPFHFHTHDNVVSCSLSGSSNTMLSSWAMQARDEYQILDRVHTLVEADYVNGRPRHHLKSARNVEFIPGASCFFIVDYNDFQRLSASTVQDIARHRSILIQNFPQREFNWSLDTLEELGALEQSRDIQGMVFCSRIPTIAHVYYLSGSIPR